ncbi:MAG TPA: hypothetical protein VMX35_16535 [Acidobacteriota bacterium]|nr:hypothetical protein [Acidobacteriota bacterium]
MGSTRGPGRIVRTIDADLDHPEETFLFPKLFRIKSWYMRNEITSLELRLEFHHGVYVLGELSFDDSDFGVFNIDYIDRLIELDRKRRSIDWSRPVALIARRSLMPVPDEMVEHLVRESENISVDYHSVAQSFLDFLEEQKSLTLFTNNSYGITSLLGESEDEFRKLCYSYANAEKSERALELGMVFERKIDQIARSYERVDPPAMDAREEIALAWVEDFRLACKSLLNKAINLQILEQQEYQVEGSHVDTYIDTLKADAESIVSGLESRREDFISFANGLIEEFKNLESEFVTKAESINSVEAPLSKFSIQILRVARVWLPYWGAEYSLGDEERSLLIKAY